MTSKIVPNFHTRARVFGALLFLVLFLGVVATATAQTQAIYCGSDDGRYRSCPADTQGGVRLVNQQSKNECVQGRTWGYKRDYIWVDRGCRADFEVGYPDDNRNRDRDRDGNRDRDRDRDRFGRNSHGSVTWTGKVDHDIKLVIYGSRLDFYNLSGKSYGPGRYYFSGSGMPRDVNVTVSRNKGRKDVEVTEQPSRYNKYSAIIRITDRHGGDDDTEVTISW